MQAHDAHTVANQVGERCFARLIGRIRDGDEIALENLMAAFVVTLRRMVELHRNSVERSYIDADDLIQSASEFLSHGLRTGQLNVTMPPQLVQAAIRFLTSQRIGRPQELEATFEGGLIATMSDLPLGSSAGQESGEGICFPVKYRADFDAWIFELFPQSWQTRDTV